MSNKLISLAFLAISTLSCYAIPQSENRKFALGADISGTTHDESRGVVSYDCKGNVVENTRLMKDLGLNAVRLRVWVDPKGGWSGPEDVLEMSRRAKANGMDIMIDFHYSDWWADPQKQVIPAAWNGKNLHQMEEALGEHTRSTLQLLKDNDIDVKWVQVGNETSFGFLWPVGHTDDMAAYASLTNAGYDAVKSVYPDAKVIVHLDNGFDQTLYDRVFDGLLRHGGKWDIIGLSVYPYWAMKAEREDSAQSTLDDTVKNLNHLWKKYGTELMIVETGVDVNHPKEGKQFMTDLIKAAQTVANGNCTGVFYWAPEASGEQGGYQLGAFMNHQPTIIMKAFTEASQTKE